MNFTFANLAIACCLLLGMFALLEMGRKLRLRHTAQNGKEPAGSAAVDGAVFGLLGLLIGFTFSGALTRFDHRRQLIVEEANGIGTAYLRLDLLSAEDKHLLQPLFRRYLDLRLAAYRKLPDISAALEELASSVAVQKEIWTNAITACSRSKSAMTGMLLLTSLNQMIDISEIRTAAAFEHPPVTIYVLLAALALVAAFLTGYGLAGVGRNWIYTLLFPLVTALALFVILDLEYPRLGFIRVEPFDRVLEQVRRSMD